ncbi:MAG: hypothetical protein R3C01_13090 [Planctomycetaceae bacterium]
MASPGRRQNRPQPARRGSQKSGDDGGNKLLWIILGSAAGAAFLGVIVAIGAVLWLRPSSKPAEGSSVTTTTPNASEASGRPAAVETPGAGATAGQPAANNQAANKTAVREDGRNLYAGKGMPSSTVKVSFTQPDDVKSEELRAMLLQTEWEVFSRPAVDRAPRDWSVVADPPESPAASAPEKTSAKFRITRGATPVSSRSVCTPVSFSPMVALGEITSQGGNIRIWDVVKGDDVFNIKSLKADMGLVALSPDGRYFAGSVDQGVFARGIGVWDAKTDKFAVDLAIRKSGSPGDKGAIEGLAIPRNDRLIGMFKEVSGFSSSPRKVFLWSIPDGKEMGGFDLRDQEAIAFSPGGRYLAVVRTKVAPLSDFDQRSRNRAETRELTASSSPAIYFLDLVEGSEADHIVLPTWRPETPLSVQAMAFSRDGKQLAVLGRGLKVGKYLLYDLTTGALVKEETWPDHWLAGAGAPPEGIPLQWFADGQHLLAFERYLLDSTNGRVLKDISAPGSVLGGSRITVGNSHYLTSDGMSEGVFELAEIPLAELAQRKADPIVRPDVPKSVDERPELTPLVVPPRQLITSKATHDDSTPAVAWGVKTGGMSQAPPITMKTVTLHDRVDWQQATLMGRETPQLLLLGGTEGNQILELVNLSSGMSRLIQPSAAVAAVLGSPEGSTFAVRGGAGKESYVYVYETETLAPVSSLKGVVADDAKWSLVQDDRAVALDPDGRFRLYNVRQRQLLFEGSRASGVAWSSDGQYVGYGNGDQYHIVQVSDGQLSGTIPRVGDVIASAFSPDTTQLLLVRSVIGGRVFSVVNLQKGEIASEFALPFSTDVQSLVWDGTDYVTLLQRGTYYVIDLAQQAVAWRYTSSRGRPWLPRTHSHEGALLALSGEQLSMTPYAIPGQQVRTQLASQKLTSPLALTSGMSGTVHVSGPHQESITSNVTALLRKRGFEVGGNDFKLTLTGTSKEGLGTETLDRIGSFETLSYEKKSLEFKSVLEVGGETVWETSRTNTNAVFGFVEIDPNKGAQQQFDEQMVRRTLSWASEEAIPTWVFRKDALNGIGSTAIGE